MNIIWNHQTHAFDEYLGDDYGYESISDKKLLMKLAQFTAVTQVLFLRGRKMISLVRKYGIEQIRAASIAAGTCRDIERDMHILDVYKKEKSNDPKKIGRVTVELRKIGLPSLKKQLAAERRKLTKEQRDIYDTLKGFG